MYVYKVVHKSDDGAEAEHEMRLPESASEVTMLQWSRYHAIEPPKLPEDGNFTIRDWFDYAGYMQRVLTQAFGVPESVLPGIGFVQDLGSSDSVFAVFSQTLGVLAGYKAKERDVFRHNGQLYCFPKTIPQSFGQYLVGGEMTMGQAADALQIEHVLSAKAEDGGELMQDQHFHKDIAVVAALSRKMLPGGKVEEWPLGFSERRKVLDERIAAFQDLPMDIALDGCFFLSDLKITLAATLSSALRLRSSLLMLRSQKQ